MTTTLTHEEKQRLSVLESRVGAGFIEIGQALKEIRNSRLYRESHNTWSEYVQTRWSFTASWANMLIKRAATSEMIQLKTDIQLNATQAGFVEKVDGAENQITVVRLADAGARLEGVSLQMRHLKAAVNTLRDAFTTGAVDVGSDESVPALAGAVVVDALETAKRRQQHRLTDTIIISKTDYNRAAQTILDALGDDVDALIAAIMKIKEQKMLAS